MQRLRLIADDLTGALDTAAQFTARLGPIPVFWPGRIPDRLPPSAAVDTGTREEGEAVAVRTTARLASILAPEPGKLSYFKLDSLLRSRPSVALGALLHALAPRHCIIAPAFPFQRRITRGGCQYIQGPNGWAPTGENLPAALAAQGFAVSLARPGDLVPEGVSVWDAESHADIARVAAAGRFLVEPVLWCGTAGLAGALAQTSPGAPLGSPPAIALSRPLLGLFGSDHPMTATQLRAVARHHLPLLDETAAEAAAAISARVAATGVALISFSLPPGISRAAAGERISRAIAALLARVARPAALIAAGGETLRAVCAALEATHLEVSGQIMPGIPRSLLRGGRWDLLPVISKSGAFGGESLLAELTAPPA